jgi:hypothetical protein
MADSRRSSSHYGNWVGANLDLDSSCTAMDETIAKAIAMVKEKF